MSVRVADIPHFSSRLVTASAKAEAPLAGGSYTFDGEWTSMAIPTMLNNGSLYIVKELQFSANCTEDDWNSSLLETPAIRWGVGSSSYRTQFRDAYVLNKFTEGTEFIEMIDVNATPAELKFRMVGEFDSAKLVGIPILIANVNLLMYEINDIDFQEAFKQPWSKQFVKKGRGNS